MDNNNSGGSTDNRMTKNIDEKTWQNKWFDQGIFNSEISDKKKFLITVPWPYTSGPLHVGHGRTYTIADIMARFMRMNGFNVLFPMGFHESGTPIGAISNKIRLGDVKTLDLYKKYISQYEPLTSVNKIMESFKEPLNVANYFSGKIVEDFKSLGYSIDWRRQFRSIEPIYAKMVEWQFRTLGNQGKIKKGEHPVLYSLIDGHPVGEDDIEDGDTDKVSIEKFHIVLFKATNKNIYIGAASLRTETIFAITNLWYNSNIKYVLMELGGKNVVVSELGSIKILNQTENSKVLREFSFDELKNDSFEVPITNQIVRIYNNKFVKESTATGIVYSVPGHSVMDIKYMDELGLKIDSIEIIRIGNKISKASDFVNGDFKSMEEANAALYRNEFYDGVIIDSVPIIGGKTVKNARELISTELVGREMGFPFYESSREAKTRDGNPVIVAVIRNQWFIDYSLKEWKEKTIENVNSMEFFPEFFKKNMVDVMEWLEERACARKRGLGTPLPQQSDWVIESLSDSTIYPSFYTISNILKDADYSNLDDSFFDYVYLGKKMEGYKPDKVAMKCRKSFLYWYGVDRRVTSAAHMSNHLAFYILNHSAIFEEQFQPKGISIAGMVISNGAKISKSKGNAVSLLEVVNTHGADIFRLYVALVAEIDSTLDWNEKEVEIIHGVYETLRHNIESAIAGSDKGNSNDDFLDLFVSKFNLHVSNFVQKMNGQQIRGAYVEIIHEVIKDLNELVSSGMDKEKAIGLILPQWLKTLSPVIPHLADYFWEKMGNSNLLENEEMSVETVEKKEIEMLERFEFIKELSDDIRGIINVTSINPTEIEINLCHKDLAEDIMKIQDGDMKVKNKAIIGQVMKMRGKIRYGIQERIALDEFGEYLKRKYNCELQLKETVDVINGKLPVPGRPVIVLKR